MNEVKEAFVWWLDTITHILRCFAWLSFVVLPFLIVTFIIFMITPMSE